MNKFKLIKKIEDFAPLESQEKWDCSGWLVCTKETEISKIMLALTITKNIYKQAKKQNCDMIISHHPLFNIPIEFSDIDMYCAHTNMDKAKGGTTDTLIEKLGYKNSKIENEFVRIVELEKITSYNELTKKLKKFFPNLRVINNNNLKEIKTLGFCAGSGSEFIQSTKTDAFITGDLKFHTAIETENIVYDIGHFESEILILERFKKILEPIEIIFAEEKSPFINNK